jgi:hypothetical protein
VLIGLFVVTYFTYMRGQARLAHGMLSGEIAYHLAQAGVSAGIAYFSNTKVPGSLRRMMVTETPERINGQTEEIRSSDSPVLARLIAEYGGEATLSVELSCAGFVPFYTRAESESGIVYGKTEKFGTLRIVSTATCHDARRRVVALKPIKVVNAVPYVVSKFTLFVQEKLPGSTPNLVATRKLDLRTGEPDRANAHVPVFFRHHGHGPARSPEENGWVYLGGGDWRLNLTWGETGWGEQFQLLRRPWVITQDPAAPALAGRYASLLMQRGLFSGIHADNDLFDRFDFARAPEPVSERSTVLHLYGAPAELGVAPEIDTSPTYVLGQVHRRFLSLRYLRKLDTGQVAYLPSAGADDWDQPAPAPWPSPPPFDAKGAVFAGQYASYVPLMSQVVQESYNRAVDFLGDRQELDPPASLADTRRITHRLPQNRDFLYEPALNTGEVTIRTAGGTKLFDGSLSRLLPEDFFLAQRAVYRMPASRFPGFLAAGRRRIPGIVYFEGGDITIDRDLELDSGGILAAEGSITVAARVKVKPYGQPLVLAAIAGNIALKAAGRVEASLLALNGTLTRDPSVPLDVLGNIVVRNLDLDRLTAAPGTSAAAGVHRVTYDPRLDPTAPGGTTYSVYMGPSRDYYLAPDR